MMMIRSTRSIVPRNVRFVSTSANRIVTPAATSAVTTSSTGAQANITTTAASPASRAPAAASHITGFDGRLKSAHRHYHANSSESASGLNEFQNEANSKLTAKLLRMNDAKELAGMNH